MNDKCSPLALLESKSNAVAFGLLLVFAIVLLSPGIGQLTGITGKDEYLLSLRTPLTMMEQDRWLVPWLDGAPRLKKPPLIYWLARASFEVFGPSLVSARGLSVLFGAVLIVVGGLIAWELSRDRRYGLFTALVLASLLVLAVESRRLMLDLPSTTWSALAFYSFLRWRARFAWGWVLATAVFLAAGFLTKMPFVFMLFGSGVLALLITDARLRGELWSHKLQVLAVVVLFLLLAVPWFWYAYYTYPEYGSTMLKEDVASRRLLSFSPAPVSAVLIIAFPWSFVLLQLLAPSRRAAITREGVRRLTPMLLWWIALSVLPFFFFRSFARYMAGSAVPIAMLCAVVVALPRPEACRLGARIGMALALLVALVFSAFALWFRTATVAAVAVLLVAGLFAVEWWRARRPEHMAVSAALLWLLLIGVLYPGFGINAIPDKVLRAIEGREPILFAGPQPALLPMVLKRSLIRKKHLVADDLRPRDGRKPLIFARQEDLPALERKLGGLGYTARVVDRFQTLSSRKTWVKFARKGATSADWWRAVQQRSLAPIQSTIVMVAPGPKMVSP